MVARIVDSSTALAFAHIEHELVFVIVRQPGNRFSELFDETLG